MRQKKNLSVMKKRGSYSHKGCKNCKSNGIKCDESEPGCVSCQRRGIKCEYNKEIFFYQPAKKRRNKFKKVTLPKPEESTSFEIIDQVIDQLRLSLNDRTSKEGSDIGFGCDEMNQRNVFEVLEYVHHWRPYDEHRHRYLERKLDSKGESTKGVHYHENNPEVLEFMLHTMSASKSIYNFLLVVNDYENCVAHWLYYFSTKYSIVGVTVNSVTSNLLDVMCLDDRWICILKRNMSATLTNISKRVGECESFPEMACYLMCIMFLCSERSASRLDAWRLHLKGAYAIVAKCDSLYDAIQSGEGLGYEMKLAVDMYAWCKNWFVTSETIACLSAPKGGAIGDIHLTKTCLRYGLNTTGNNGFLIGGFNLMKGYSQELTDVFVDIIEYIMTYKINEEVSLSGSAGILHSGAVNDVEMTLGNQLLERVAQVAQQKYNFLHVKSYQQRAIMKACNVCFCCGIEIFVYSVMLGKSIYGAEVQYCVQTIEEQLATIQPIAMYGLCIHWPLFVAGLCAPIGETRTTLLNSIQTISNNGTYIARNTVERLEKCWGIIDCGGVIDEESYDCITM